MTIQTEVLGANSIAIKQSTPDTNEQLLPAIRTFLTSHGQTQVDSTTQDAAPYYNNMVFKSFNSDGVSEKYLKISYNGTYLHTHVMEDYNPTTHTMTNIATYSNFAASHAIYIPTSSNGVLYIAASARYAIFQAIYNGVTYSGFHAGQQGCIEMTSANPEDDPEVYPTYAYTNGYCFHDLNNLINQGPICPVRTRLYTGTSATSYNYAMCPLGGQGYIGEPLTNTPKSYDVLHHTLNPWNNKYQAFDVGIVYDKHVDNAYFKGMIHGLKLITSGVGNLGDIIKIKVNSSNFIDNGATETTDFIIFQRNAYRVAFPA